MAEKIGGAMLWLLGAAMIVNNTFLLWTPQQKPTPAEALALLASGWALFRSSK